MGCLFMFVDGVGIGRRDPATNPLAGVPSWLSFFDDGTGPALPPSARFAAADATLGVPGRPQSATGQATIFTGQNAPAFLGRHLLGFPNAALRTFIRERSVFRRLVARGARVAFANAYPACVLRLLGLPHRPSARPEPELPPRARHARLSASTCALAAAGVPLCTLDDAWDGLALTHDFTGERARARGFDAPERTPEDCAAIAQGLLAEHDVVLVEHFLLDEAGHARDAVAAHQALAHVDRFLRAAAGGLSPQDTLLVASDHGNVEDLTTRSHTRNRVPVLVIGARNAIASDVSNLCDLAPALEVASGVPVAFAGAEATC